MTSHDRAVALNVITDRNGQTWISVDSLVDLFEDMAGNVGEDKQTELLVKLAASFRPASSYAQLGEMMPTADDDSVMVARICTCGATVIDGVGISGDPRTIDAEPVSDGGYFPLRIVAGVPTLVPYTGNLDGVGITIRLREHVCGERS